VLKYRAAEVEFLTASDIEFKADHRVKAVVWTLIVLRSSMNSPARFLSTYFGSFMAANAVVVGVACSAGAAPATCLFSIPVVSMPLPARSAGGSTS
jgi:hypothetical protein